jgi:peptidoglycan/LPS O-acetylase OafA/YrhL
MSRQNNYSLLHITGALFVTLGHSFELSLGWTPQFCGDSIQGFGLALLFCVSGFLVTNSWLSGKDGYFKYLVKRITRLYPALLFCLLFTVIWFYFLMSARDSTYIQSAIQYVVTNARLQPYYYLNGVSEKFLVNFGANGSLWTLAPELLLFIIMPLFVNRRINKKLILAISFLIFSTSIIIYSLAKKDFYIYGINPAEFCRLGCFFFSGSICAQLQRFDNVESFLETDLFKLITIILFITSSCMPIVIFACIPCIVLLSGRVKPIACDFFNKHDYAYGIYLYSFPFTQTIAYYYAKRISPDVNIGVVFFGTLLLAIGMAVISKKSIEDPATKFMNRMMKNSRLWLFK